MKTKHTRHGSWKNPPPQNLRWKGVVEGFYGKPWSAAARCRLFPFMREKRLNTYIYAPKSDPFHRRNWRQPYPPAQKKSLSRLTAEARKHGIAFFWAVSPGLSIRYDDAQDLNAVASRLFEAADFGASGFAVFFDDLPAGIHAKHGKFPSLAAAQAHVTNRLFRLLGRKLPSPTLFFCPTLYWGTEPAQYLKTLGKQLDGDIQIFWTGPMVVSPEITAAQARKMTEILNRPPLLWDNYPVNDYNPNRLNLGPVMGRDPDLPALVSGYFANPMNQPEASLIPLETIADFLRDPHGYNPRSSWKRAFRRAAGGGPSRALLIAAGLLRPGFFPGEPQPNLAAAMRRFLDAPDPADERSAAAALGKELALVRASAARTAAVLKRNGRLYTEIKPFLKKIELSAVAAESALRCRFSGEKEKEKACRAAEKTLKKALSLPHQAASGLIEDFAEILLERNLTGT
ncbi:MAG: protein O-GlcNAcase [bacterium]